MFKKLAKIKYLPNNYQILEEGDYVICAISLKKNRSILVKSNISGVWKEEFPQKTLHILWGSQDSE